ncbi:hypothetical protein [Haloglomus salinum]|jgi:hypothetical protein|uniref:hypothetical protein n=1 Tax=Haloglomus salinum TaxID=2962673 RepID=UPI0020C9451E|nr:hypothetical protein [Haloglomus salinum]
MGDETERDPEATLEEWKESMQDEHERAIAEPDPDAAHEVEGVVQVSYRVGYDYDPDEGLVVAESEQVDERGEPELLGCSCGVRGMTREEAREHLAAARGAE